MITQNFTENTEYFVDILVFRCLFYLFLFNGVLLRKEISKLNPLALTVIQHSI